MQIINSDYEDELEVDVEEDVEVDADAWDAERLK